MGYESDAGWMPGVVNMAPRTNCWGMCVLPNKDMVPLGAEVQSGNFPKAVFWHGET